MSNFQTYLSFPISFLPKARSLIGCFPTFYIITDISYSFYMDSFMFKGFLRVSPHILISNEFVQAEVAAPRAHGLFNLSGWVMF